ncbi:MAG: X2-like carbohydrate binding domain-containing protein [Hespellia sp.]|nr:X2-like carbohydrate binding domain-containing protein [Hespellia sp.]
MGKSRGLRDKITAMILSLAMILSMIPAMSFTSFAEENADTQEVTFTYTNENAQSVYVAGDFNGYVSDAADWEMKKDSQGIWTLTKMIPSGDYDYQFVVDGTWMNDPKNDSDASDSDNKELGEPEETKLPAETDSEPVSVFSAASRSAHAHCVCGTEHASVGEHTSYNSVEFTEWTSTTSLPTAAGNYYLANDVQITTGWKPASGTVLCLNGHSITYTGSKWASVIEVSSNNTFTLTDCASSTAPGKITSAEGVTARGVCNYGIFHMYGGSITGNKSGGNNGAGIYSGYNTYTTTNLCGGSIETNSANDSGGGIYSVNGTVNLYKTNIKNNSAGFGGGIYNLKSTVNLSGGTIDSNSVTGSGGGIFNRSYLKMSGGTISNNTATATNSGGGGVYNNPEYSAGEFVMSGGSINANRAAMGGGVYVERSDVFAMSGGSMKKNTATEGGGVYCNSGRVNLSGGPTIQNNTCASGRTGDLYTKDTAVCVVDKLTTSGKIGFSTDLPPGPVVIGSDGYTMTKSDFTKFTVADTERYTIEFNETDYKVYRKNKYLTLKSSDFKYQVGSFTYDGKEKPATVEPNEGVNCGNITQIWYAVSSSGSPVWSKDIPVNVGTYHVAVDVAENNVYDAAEKLGVYNIYINKKPLKISVSDVTIKKGQNLPNLEVVVAAGGFVGTDSPENLEGFSLPTAKPNGTVDTLDTKLTTFNVSYTGGNATGNYKFNYTSTANITIETVEVGAEDYGVSPDNTQWQKDALILTPKNDYTLISADGTNWAESLTLSKESSASKDSEQTFYLKKEDGTVTESKTITYKLDQTAPEADIKVAENSIKSLINKLSFGLFFKNTVDVDITGSDSISGVNTIEYQKVADESAYDPDGTWTAEDRLSVNDNEKFIVYAKVTDHAGNQTIINSKGVVCYSDSSISPATAEFNLETEKQAAIKVTMKLNGNTLREIKNGETTLTVGTDYTVDGENVTISKDYLKQFEKDTKQTLTFVFNPMGVTGDTTSTATAVISITDSTHYHTEAVLNAKVEPTCTEDGRAAYWYCDVCGKYFADQNGAIDTSTAYDDTKSFVLTKTGHSFTKYVSNGDATYFEDGTETASCDHAGCQEKDTRTASGSKLVDSTAPTGTITVGKNEWNTFLNNITFGLFFKETQTVTVTSADAESGVDQTYYYLSDKELSEDEADAVRAWTAYEKSFDINPDKKYVVYVKITDKVSNSVIINSNGLVLDGTAPQVSAANGKTYCKSVDVTVTDENLVKVTLDGAEVTLDGGKFTVSSKEGAQTIVAVDKAGNETTAAITVNQEHTWNEGIITKPATAADQGIRTYTCKYCDESYTELIDKISPTVIEGGNGTYIQGSKDGLTVKSDAAYEDFLSVSVDGNVLEEASYHTAPGSIVVTLKPEYLATLAVGTHTLDIVSATGTASTQFTIAAQSEEEKPGDTTKPGDITKPGDTTKPGATTKPGTTTVPKIQGSKATQTGDNSHLTIWLLLLVVSGGVVMLLSVQRKTKKNKIRRIRR